MMLASFRGQPVAVISVGGVSWRVFICVWAAALGFACAAAPRPSFAPARDWSETALRASGFNQAKEMNEARARLDRLTNRLRRAVGPLRDVRTKGERLLRMLHGPEGALRTYDVRATTLRDVLFDQRYNCVSASVLYNLIAERLGLVTRAELRPTHARSALLDTVASTRIVVETTSPEGFDPDPQEAKRMLRRIAGGSDSADRVLVPEAGTWVATDVLIGLIYVNRATLAEEAKKNQAAERLFQAAEQLLVQRGMLQVLRDQRAALLAQLGVDDIRSGVAARYSRAHRTLLRAARLESQLPAIRKVVRQNLRAASERFIASMATQAGPEAVMAVVEDSAQAGLGVADVAGLTAFAFSEIARVHLTRKDYRAALEAFDAALAQPIDPSEQRLLAALKSNRVMVLRHLAAKAASAGQLQGGLAWLTRAAETGLLSPADLAADRKQIIKSVGTWRFKHDDFDGAAEVLRLGRSWFPKDAELRHNLVAVLSRRVQRMIETQRCRSARPLIGEIRGLEPRSRFAKKASAVCQAAGQPFDGNAARRRIR